MCGRDHQLLDFDSRVRESLSDKLLVGKRSCVRLLSPPGLPLCACLRQQLPPPPPPSTKPLFRQIRFYFDHSRFLSFCHFVLGRNRRHLYQSARAVIVGALWLIVHFCGMVESARICPVSLFCHYFYPPPPPPSAPLRIITSSHGIIHFIWVTDSRLGEAGEWGWGGERERVSEGRERDG